LKLCSRSATTAAKKFAVLIFWFVLHQGKMNECNSGMDYNWLKSTNTYYMGNIVRDTMITDKGYLKLYFKNDWTYLSYADSTETVIMDNIGRDHVTPGHDIETAFLLLEAAHALGLEEDDETHRIAKKLTDHTLETGWDPETGGFYDTGYYFDDEDQLTILQDSKNWWAQAEGLNTLVIMTELYPDDPRNYYEAFLRQWEYIKRYLIDKEHGGWFDSGLDKRPDRRTASKSHIWKGNYHTVRSLMGCIDRLNGMAGLGDQVN
jgi:cellobiose epimerase